jgi:hypothetical protein
MSGLLSLLLLPAIVGRPDINYLALSSAAAAWDTV